MKHSLPERIRLQRLQRGLSQENMADLLSLSTTAYGDIERGKTDLTLSRLSQIATVLDVSPVTLLTDEAIPAQVIDSQPVDQLNHELETLRLTVEKQQVELEKLRLEAEFYKRRYDDRIALELARSIGMTQSRERIGF
ncbi:helix-turn-helix domain-containing protein [Spirosoma utsteinense]|uniref:Transcriptional regulator with XRE-family HTH domain n=1 Tax=Spirosoma utsteinense TaxID=2585773 RepID=A0ABR6WAB7_9BACT|nr:helix-turn-helix transcriptional regulator [Spirosoma utsteinense]MBC3784068.1 transcriptional regulator with XRE-family HTH domain [Spirosoma utsteinense]MBC3793442.1 transcriptional regulator with XRE-family HTH domain [Spirosoma utsteinense]